MTTPADLDVVNDHLEDRVQARERTLRTAVRRHGSDLVAVSEDLAAQGFHASEDEIARQVEEEFPTGPDARRSGLVTQTEVFVATAVASGVIGNLAYDVLKQGFAAVASRLPVGRPDAPDPESVMALLARAAVIEQCERHDLTCPAPGDLQVGRWRYGADGAGASVTSRDGTLHADVHVGGRRPGRDAGVTVLLRQVTGPGDRSWIADRTKALVEYPAFAGLRTSLEDLGDEPLDRRAVERSLRRITSDPASLHDLVRAVDRAQRRLAGSAPLR